MKSQFTRRERIIIWLSKRLDRTVARIYVREEKRREAMALPKGTIIRCTCAKCLVVNPKEGREWRIQEYESDCDQYKAFAADGIQTDLFSSVAGRDRDWFKDGTFEVVRIAAEE